MDVRTWESQVCSAPASHDATHEPVRSAELPSLSAIGSVVRRASLIAAAVHACERASAESRISRLSAILPAEGHP